METLKYKVIKTRSQYMKYCKDLEALLEGDVTKAIQEEIDLLTLLIDTYDREHTIFKEVDPVRLLTSLMKERNMKAKDLVELLNVSKGYVSEILSYKKGISKDAIRKLAEHFKLSQEAFNRPYKLKVSEKTSGKNAYIKKLNKSVRA